MGRIITAEKHGFKVTWNTDEKGKENHKWWHWFFRRVECVTMQTNIKGKLYTRSRAWITTCRKCDYAKIEVRELWLPGEEIPKDDDNTLLDGLALGNVLSELDKAEAQCKSRQKENNNVH